MTWIFDVNRLVDQCNAIFYYLKENLVAAGWTVRGSGDGNALYEDVDQGTGGAGTGSGGAYDVWTSTCRNSARVPGCNAYGGAWVRLREPGSTREFIFHRHGTDSTTYDDNWSIQFSHLGFPLGGANANTPPSSVIFRWLAYNYPSQGPATGTWFYIHIGAEGAAINGVYPWFQTSTIQTTSVISGTTMYEAMGTMVTGDPQPYVMWSNTGTWNAANMSHDSYTAYNFTFPAGFRGGAETLFVTCPAVYYQANGTTVIPGGIPSSSLDGGDRGFPIPYLTRINGFYKGIGHTVKWAGTPRSYPDTFKLATADSHVYMGQCLLPWPTGVAPSP